MLEIKELKKVYDTGEQALNGVSMEVDGKETVAVIGPSGAGKSTLLRCINSLVNPTSGEIYLDGKEITGLSKKEVRKVRRDIGFVFQEFNLVERLTVMENILSGRLGYVSNWNAFRRNFPPEDIQSAFELLDIVGLSELEDNRADELSGGQRQRVGIARAIIQEPKILLVDEPTSSLDPETATTVMTHLSDVAGEYDIPILINIHDVDLALEFANRIVGLSDGSIVWDGAPSEFDEEARDIIYRGASPADTDAAASSQGVEQRESLTATHDEKDRFQ